MNILQDFLDIVLGPGVLLVSDIDADILFCGVLFFLAFIVLGLRNMFKYFMGITRRF